MRIRMKELSLILSRLKDIDRPKPELEQWTTPPEIVSRVLAYAYEYGDIEDRICADLGCGNGIFAIGMALLGARNVTGIDIDEEAISTAKENARIIGELYGRLPIEFILGDVRSIDITCDTIIMNPPFGLNKKTKHADRYFLVKAFYSSDVVYSLHYSSPRSRKFFEKLASSFSFSCYHIASFDFPLRTRFWFHKRKKIIIKVDLMMFRKKY